MKKSDIHCNKAYNNCHDDVIDVIAIQFHYDDIIIVLL